MGKFLAYINAFNFADEYLRADGNCYSRKFGYPKCRLTDYLSVKRAIDDDSFANSFGFGIRQEITAAFSKFIFDRIINFIGNDN